MIELGKSLKHLREAKCLTQKEAARELDITDVYLSNLERGKAKPSLDFLNRVHKCWGVDLHIFAWCFFGNQSDLPQAVRGPAKELTRVWRAELKKQGIHFD